MLNNLKIVAGIVTYNRKKLLLECLGAVLNQSFPVEKVILIDNASTDGTYEELAEKGFLENSKIIYVKMEKNTGGSGGFHKIFSEISMMECDWVWIMDDDTIPSQNCLEELVKALDILNRERLKLALNGGKISTKHSSNQTRPISFLAGSIFGENGEYMNVPDINDLPSDNGYPYWYEMLSHNMINIKSATFVSLLINKNAVLQCGLPCKDYFIWGDDTEYTRRMTTFFGDAFLVGSSVAIHKRIGAKALNIEYEIDPNRIKMFHYFYRNNNINLRLYNHENKIKLLIKGIVKAFRVLFKSMGFAKCKAILKGNFEALLQYKKFRSYIEDELKKDNAFQQ